MNNQIWIYFMCSNDENMTFEQGSSLTLLFFPAIRTSSMDPNEKGHLCRISSRYWCRNELKLSSQYMSTAKLSQLELFFLLFKFFVFLLRRTCGHVNVGTRPHQVLASTLTLSQPGGQIMPTLHAVSDYKERSYKERR